jgi:hypothetical protein
MYIRKYDIFARFDVLAAVLMKIRVFWHDTLSIGSYLQMYPDSYARALGSSINVLLQGLMSERNCVTCFTEGEILFKENCVCPSGSIRPWRHTRKCRILKMPSQPCHENIAKVLPCILDVLLSVVALETRYSGRDVLWFSSVFRHILR